MSNALWLVAGLILAAVGLLVALSISQQPHPDTEPAVISLDERRAQLNERVGASVEPLFGSGDASLALMRVGTEVPAHVHHESNEVVLVLGGSGWARSGANEFRLTPDTMLIVFAGTPISLEREGDEPLDILIFLTPPSYEGNVTRLGSDDFSRLSQSALSPMLIDVHEQTTSLSVMARAIPFAALGNFSPTGNAGVLQLLKGASFSSRNSASSMMMLVLSGEVLAQVGALQSNLAAGDLIIIPARSRYLLEERLDEPANIIFFATPPWQAP